MQYGKYAGRATFWAKNYGRSTCKIFQMQRRGKMGSGARPKGIPGGRRDVTRRAAAGGICPYCGSEQVASAIPRRSLVRENGGYRRSGRAASAPSNGETMHILPFRRRTGMRPDQTNGEREREATASLFEILLRETNHGKQGPLYIVERTTFSP